MTARIYLTENCNASCPWCFNKGTRDPTLNMDTERAKKLFDWFSKNGLEEILVMGGEPTIHPDFIELWNYIHRKGMYARLFTNGKEIDKINQIEISPRDSIIYNFDFISFPVKKELFYHFCNYRFEVVLRKQTDIVKLIEKINMVHQFEIEHHMQFRYNITPDCTENWFNEKELLNDKLRELLNYARKNRTIFWSWDHAYPICLFDKDVIDLIYGMLNTGGLNHCSGQEGCVGLVTSNFNLVHCNQYRNVKLSLIKEDDNFISYKEAENFLYFENLHKIESLRNSSCANCKYFRIWCNGGCIAHKFNH